MQNFKEDEQIESRGVAQSFSPNSRWAKVY